MAILLFNMYLLSHFSEDSSAGKFSHLLYTHDKVYTFSNYCNPPSTLKKQAIRTNSSDTVIGLVSMFRHGDRTPITFNAVSKFEKNFDINLKNFVDIISDLAWSNIKETTIYCFKHLIKDEVEVEKSDTECLKLIKFVKEAAILDQISIEDFLKIDYDENEAIL
ncbi:hypothetical protein A3Q56_06374, partial [Intoshia linei]